MPSCLAVLSPQILMTSLLSCWTSCDNTVSPMMKYAMHLRQGTKQTPDAQVKSDHDVVNLDQGH